MTNNRFYFCDTNYIKMKHSFLIKIILIITFMTIQTASSNNKKIENTIEGKNHLYKILHYASLAGSSHNTQPWKVEVFPNDSIVIYADTSRQLKVVDNKSVELLISIGAFIENLDIAANAIGYTTKITINDIKMNMAMPIIAIKIEKNGMPIKPDDIKELILRTTLRIPFDKKQIKNDDKESLISIAPENIVYVSSNSTEGSFIAKKELEAYTLQAYQKDAQDELANWMCFSNKDVNSKLDGITPASMGMKGISRFIVSNFFKPQDSKKESFVKKEVEKTKNQVENCGGWIIISTENDEISDWINVGRIYERINIKCRSLNIGFHPMNQIIETPSIFNEVNDKINKRGKIRFISRIGYVYNYPLPVSKRRTVESFAIFK